MDNASLTVVIQYFVSVGAGLTLGIALVFIPTVLIYKKIQGGFNSVKTSRR